MFAVFAVVMHPRCGLEAPWAQEVATWNDAGWFAIRLREAAHCEGLQARPNSTREAMVMGNLTVNMFVTLDGVIQAPGRPEEDKEGGFQFGGWQAPVSDEKTGADITRNLLKGDALLLGRKTYDIFAGYWPTASGPIADNFNGVPKYVASRTLTKPAWKGTTVLAGDLAKAVAQIKKRHKEIHTWGSSQVFPTLLRHGLVDVLDLYLYPVVLGAGKRLFPEGVVPTAFKLTHSATYEKGGVHLRYEPNGKPEFASMG